jgi:transcriptional regulator with XRE-family HTH domain
MGRIVRFVKQRREALGLSQKDLANAIGLTSQAVSAWERRGSEYIRPKHLMALSRVLGVSVEDLIRGNGASRVSLSDEAALLIAYRKLGRKKKKLVQKILRNLTGPRRSNTLRR